MQFTQEEIYLRGRWEATSEIIRFVRKKNINLFVEPSEADECLGTIPFLGQYEKKRMYNGLVYMLNRDGCHPLDSPQNPIDKNNIQHSCSHCGFTKIIWYWIPLEGYDWCIKYICPFCGNRGDYNSKTKRNQFFPRNVTGLRGHKCAICGSTDNVEVHHIIPVHTCEKTGQTALINDPHNGIPLCRYHHNLAHGKIGIPPENTEKQKQP